MAKTRRSGFAPEAPRAKRLAEEADLLLPPKLRGAEPAVPQPRPTQVELFRTIRGFARGAERLAELTKVFSNLGDQVTAVLKQFGKDASFAGAADAKQLSDRMIQFLSNFGIKAKNIAEFRRSLRGYRSNMNGEMFEWVVNGNRDLAADVAQWGASEARDLNGLARSLRGKPPKQLATLPERIVNARADPVALPPGGSFGAPQPATDIYLRMKDGTRRKFVDAMTVSLYARGNAKPTHMSPTTLGQYKFKTAIRKVAGQAERDPGRLADAEALVFKVGGEQHEFSPEQVLFATQQGRPELNQYVVTHADSLVTDFGRKQLYSSDPSELLGGGGAAPPQVTPIVGRGGKVRAVLVELSLDSRLVLALSDLVFGP